MTEIELTIGWTRSDMANGYSSFGGYKPGASQHNESVTLRLDGPPPIPTLEFVEQIAEAVFAATNDPNAHPDEYGTMAERLCAAITATGYRGEGAHYSLSVGDTVTVGEITLACANAGWERVIITPPVEYDPHHHQKHRYYEEN